MKIALFSQSLFSLDLAEAIATTARIGFSAIELACTSPHFDIETARREPDRVAGQVRDAGLTVAALSLFTRFTDPECLDDQVDAAGIYIRLAPLFGTKLLKLTPGPPASATATAEHWHTLSAAVDRLVPLARGAGVRLAFETHMRQLTDTSASSQRLLALAPTDAVGLTVDFSNLSFAGEKMADVVRALKDRMLHTHVKNGYVDPQGGWHFQALDEGLTDYAEVLTLLRAADYEGYLAIECLGEDARREPVETARRDLEILLSLLSR
jgi:sugar phosphate isomerase/epimerase